MIHTDHSGNPTDDCPVCGANYRKALRMMRESDRMVYMLAGITFLMGLFAGMTI